VELTTLGRTGMQVSTLCFGAMTLGRWGNPDEAECIAMVHRALDAGINFIDTADVYGQGDSETIVGKALAGRRDEVVLATKLNHQFGEGINHSGNSRRWIMRQIDGSLRRLGTDWIDLYQLHRPDPTTDIGDTLSAMTDLVRAGKVRAIGTSTFPAHELVEAHWAAERRGLERVACEQPPYSLLVRGIEADVLPVVQRHGMGAIVWSPLCAGWLWGGWRAGREAPPSQRAVLVPARFDLSLPGNRAKLEAVEQLAVLAEEAGLTLPQLALGFVAEHPAVTSAIIGPRTPEQLEAYLANAGARLGADVLDRIDEIVPPGTVFAAADVAWEPLALRDASLRRGGPAPLPGAGVGVRSKV
jgi:aryl-alcohol dehydrogenase-like predicted oxidoreductase